MQIVHPEVEAYVAGLLEAAHADPVLEEMEAWAEAEGYPIVGRAVGSLLELQARSVGARRVIELGSGFGYSAYWFGRAVGPSGELHLTDADPANEERAQEFLSRADMWERVTFHVGDALTSFALAGGEFDIVYCDVAKGGYPDCWRAARDRIRLGGLWVCDNTLWSGRVLDEEKDDLTRAIDEHNRLVAEDADYVSTIIPIRDGLMAALRVR